MSEPQTPDWVRDAVFYQIFPDRFARSLTVPKPAHLDAWGAPPTLPRLPGGRPRRRRRAARLPGRPGRQRDLLHADLPVGLEPPLPHARLREGRPDARRQRRPPPADRRGPRAGHPGRARRRVQPRQPRLLPVPRHPGERPELGLPRLVPRPRASRSTPTTPTSRPSYRRLVGPARPAQVQHRHPGGPRVPLGDRPATGSTSASTAGGSTSPTRSTTTTSGASSAAGSAAGNPEAYIVGEVWTDARRWLQGDMWDAVMNYLFTRACIAFFIGEDGRRGRAAADQPPYPLGPTGAEAFRDGDRAAARPLPPERHGGAC